MRSIFLVLSACAAVSQAAECEAADEATMLQMRNMAHIKKHTKGAKAVLKSLQEVAQSMTKGSRKTMSKDDVDDALNAADAALATLSPTIQTQVTQAQQQVDDAAAAVQACHGEDGYTTRASLQNQVDEHATSLSTCQTELEGLTQEATAQCAIAEDCLCDEANVRMNDKAEICAARTEVYEIAYCEHNLACTNFGECHANEMAVYESLRADVEAEIVTIQQEYIAVEQSQCLMGLIIASMSTGTPIDANAMLACNTVDASAIAINYPTLPDTPAACPGPTLGNPPCVHVPCRSVEVLSNDHVQGNFGKYFNFDLASAQLQLGRPLITNQVLMAWSEQVGAWREVVVWTNPNGGSVGDAHGRLTASAAPGDWAVGDRLTFAAFAAIDVLSNDHAQGPGVIGKYFNFDVASAEAALGSSLTGSDILTVWNDNGFAEWREVIVWNNPNGGSVGDGHGRLNSGAAAGDWEVGDRLELHSPLPSNPPQCGLD